MDQIINNLKGKEILYSKSVQLLKSYIEKKYPEADALLRAQVFADAVHKIIDGHIKEFSRTDQKKIKMELLSRTADRENFEIVAYDIMKTCVSLSIDEETFYDDLTSWINHQQNIHIYRDQLNDLTEAVRQEIAQEETAIAEQGMPELLDQISSTRTYNPIDTHEEEDDLPELYSQGAVNQAYESELLRDIGQYDKDYEDLDAEGRDMDSYDPVLISASLGAISDTEEDGHQLASAGNGASPLSIEEKAAFTEREEQKEIEQQERPVIKVEMDIEPYFSDIPEVWENTGKKSLIDEVREALEGWDPRVLALAFISCSAVFAALIWLVVYVTGNLQRIEDIPMSSESGIANDVSVQAPESIEITETLETVTQKDKSSDHLHSSLQYKEINREALQSWFVRNDSLIGEEPHFSTIIEVAEDYGVNPLLLFAITGQEQGFVPKEHEFADMMINNPFNVYGSWEIYNTDLKESAQIAARTVLTASEERPEDVDPVVWINQTYAEDRNWSTGVNIILEQLEIVAGNE